ncbi:hypothetical protein ACET3Z_013681 [Daucus carota]
MIMMDESDELTFRVNFNGDQLSNLQHLIKDKLKDFMGDYTDDTLVEYVIVLLKNGRRKVEAKKELNVFLGDDSDCFVSLWDHLEKHLDLYVRPSNACEGATTKPTFREQPTKIVPDGPVGTHHMDAEQERQKRNNLSRSKFGGQWKGIVKDAVETPPLRSMVTSNTLVDEDAHIKDDHLKVSLQSRPILQRKRHRPDERNPMKVRRGFFWKRQLFRTTIFASGIGVEYGLFGTQASSGGSVVAFVFAYAKAISTERLNRSLFKNRVQNVENIDPN